MQILHWQSTQCNKFSRNLIWIRKFWFSVEGRIRSKICSSSRKFWHEWLDNLWGDNWTNYRNSAPSPKTITATKMQNNYKLTWALSSHFWEPLQQVAMNNKLKLHLLWSEFNAGHVCGSQVIIHPHHPGYSAPPTTTPTNRNKRKMIYRWSSCYILHLW